MKFLFEPFPGSVSEKWKASQEELAAIFKGAAKHAVGQSTEDDFIAQIKFYVIDVRPRPNAENDVEDGLRELHERLLDLFLPLGEGPDASLFLEESGEDDQPKISRLLFVGERAALDEWEDEEPVSRRNGRISVKKSIEFYIRSAQAAGLAHYCGLGADVDAQTKEELAAAAIANLADYFRNTTYNPPETRKETLRIRCSALQAETATAIEHVALREPELLDGIRGLYTKKGPLQYEELRNLLRQINAVYQLGKRSVGPAYRSLRESNVLSPKICQFVADTMHVSKDDVGFYAVREAVQQLNSQSLAPQSKRKKGAASDVRSMMIQEMTIVLRRYDFLRDLGRWIANGATNFMCKWIAPRKKPPRPARSILIIDDDVFYASKSRGPLRRKLTEILQDLKCDDQTYIAETSVLAKSDGVADDNLTLLDAIDLDDNLPRTIPVKHLKTDQISLLAPDKFDLILLEVDSKSKYVGPRAVQTLTNYLKRRLEVHRAQGSEARRAPIIVLSNTESAGHIQQCLNLGAASYVFKGRLYQLPSEMRRALDTRLYRRRVTEHASAFRSLKALRPETRSKLYRIDAPRLVTGGRFDPKTKNDEGGWIGDRREEQWIRELPKADLHCHLGTSISYKTIASLALNTVGHTLGRAELGNIKPTDGDLRVGLVIQQVITRIARVVILAEDNFRKSGTHPLHPLIYLALAAGALSEDTNIALPRFRLGDKVVEWLKGSSIRLKDYEVLSLLVAIICLEPDPRNDATDPNSYDKLSGLKSTEFLGALETVLKREVELSNVYTRPTSNARKIVPASHAKDVRDMAVILAAASFSERTKTSKPWSAWTDSQKRFSWLDLSPVSIEGDAGSRASTTSATRDAAKELLRETPNSFDLLSWWSTLKKDVEDRIRQARDQLVAARIEAFNWLHHTSADKSDVVSAATAQKIIETKIAELEKSEKLERIHAPAMSSQLGSGQSPLYKYVTLPKIEADQVNPSKGLQRYLWGADLLGSEHLQYPENLLMAAYSLTLDNALDNVVYTEVRCETPGYCKAGMDRFQATDLLRSAFDLASLFIRGRNDLGSSWPLPLVRTNILLAAKRHKTEPEARDVVSLLEFYLREVDERRQPYSAAVSDWWKPCRVVGFDVSGNESAPAEWLSHVVEPLVKISSPITIHAGEAATAESIWNAVYPNHARRIGHGLRLGENLRLMRYCIDEGICMEMCPNSNAFTNAFSPERAKRRITQEGIDSRNVYPLLFYMKEGLEVSIGTDNRYIHNEDAQTLTSEYLMAARLSGGLTRWEVLQLIKAGFKNSFLHKKDVETVVSTMEERIYRIISRGWF